MSTRHSPDSNDGPPRKKMRQGTHSCIECRRRKIKCIFQAEKNGTCNECYARSVSCIDQESAAEAQTLETRQSLRERVANLESIIKVIATKIDIDQITTTTPSSRPSSSPKQHVILTTANSDLAPSEAGYHSAPIMSLFNNSMTTYAAVPTTESPIPEVKSEEDKIRAKLLAKLPSDKDIEAIWAKCSHWWSVWARMFPEFKYNESSNVGPEYIKKNAHSADVLSLSKAILCLCLALQQVEASFAKQHLKLPLARDDLIQYYLSTIHDQVFSSDCYLNRIEGLEIAMLLAKIDVNTGRPRKAWMTYRRGISFALLQGLNRKTTWQVTSADPNSGPKRRAIFWALFAGDRYLSLILGLPYSVSDQQCDISAMTDGLQVSNVSSKAMYELSNLGGRLIERYQSPDLVSLATTNQYDRQLQELRKQLPTIESLNPKNNTQMFVDVYDHTLALIYFGYVRSLLHLPFLLKFGDPVYDTNRQIVLDSAREMIQAYIYLRESTQGEYLNCRIVDFQIFLVCLVLMINAIAVEPFKSTQSGYDSSSSYPDWDLVERVKQLLESAERGSTGAVIVQDSAIKTLHKLLECRDGCPDDGDSTTISIPYFGNIRVTARAEVKAAMMKPRQQFATPSATMSSCDSPQSNWQLPTPPISADSKLNPYVSFDRDTIPMPTAYDMNALGGNAVGDFAFNNSIYMNDMVGGYDWLSMPVTYDIEQGNEWLPDQQLGGQMNGSMF